MVLEQLLMSKSSFLSNFLFPIVQRIQLFPNTRKKQHRNSHVTVNKIGNAEGNLFTPRANVTAVTAAGSEYISNDFTIFNVTAQSNSTAPQANDHIDTICPVKMSHFR